MFPYNLCNGPDFHFTWMTLKVSFFLHSMHYNSVTTFPATKCTLRKVSVTSCWRLALQYICCVLSLVWHSVSFLLSTSSCHSFVPASWQWQFSQMSCGSCSAVLTSKFKLSIFISYCWEIIVTYSRLVWNSTCFSAGIRTLNDESLCDIINGTPVLASSRINFCSSSQKCTHLILVILTCIELEKSCPIFLACVAVINRTASNHPI
jgi:hypothetical protein